MNYFFEEKIVFFSKYLDSVFLLKNSQTLKSVTSLHALLQIINETTD